MIVLVPMGTEISDAETGAWLGEGKDARQLKGAIRDAKSRLVLQDKIAKADLEKLYGGKMLHIWQYGAGDEIEIARLK